MLGDMATRARLTTGQWIAAVALMWAGIVIGVSFIATPAKFGATSLSLPVAIEIGRQTFRVLHYWELGLAAVTIALLLWRRPARPIVIGSVLAIGVLAVQLLVLMPALAPASDSVISGGESTRALLHWVFIASEAAKVAILLVTAYLATRPPPESV